jgi:RNA polymerase sigma factor (TIGR02999 family)
MPSPGAIPGFVKIPRRIKLSAVSNVTRILDRAQQGDPNAAAELLPLVYDELRKLAAQKMAHEAAGQTLQPTALVHEAWLRLAGSQQQWSGRGHFFAAAAEAMRRILIDRARKRNRERHGASLQRVNLDSVDLAATSDDETLLALDDALTKLAAEAPEKAELIKLRYFTGLSIAEAARALGISDATAKRHWAYARAWLYCELTRA